MDEGGIPALCGHVDGAFLMFNCGFGTCPICGEVFQKRSGVQRFCSDYCSKAFTRENRRKKRKRPARFSGLDYENTPEKIERLKEKYRNGVTAEILKEFAEKL